MDEKQFRILSGKMDTIIKLLALSAIKGKEVKEQVWLLSSSGFQPKDIADILRKTPNHIRVILHRLRKERKQLEAEAVVEQQAKLQEGENHA